MATTSELRPCPRCLVAEHLEVCLHGLGWTWNAVDCHECGASGPHGKTEAEARQLWNERKGETK